MGTSRWYILASCLTSPYFILNDLQVRCRYTETENAMGIFVRLHRKLLFPMLQKYTFSLSPKPSFNVTMWFANALKARSKSRAFGKQVTVGHAKRDKTSMYSLNPYFEETRKKCLSFVLSRHNDVVQIVEISTHGRQIDGLVQECSNSIANALE